jgi:hypothetical protein
MPGYTFEKKIQKVIKSHLEANNITGIVKRIPMTKFQAQHIDLEIDSPEKSWYCGIECKSCEIALKSRKPPPPVHFTFSSHFGEGQFERISEFLSKSGRRGFMALEVNYVRHF